MLARIKGGYKTSAEHQSSNQGTAATMRAFVVSSPSTISRFPNFSFLPPLLTSVFSFLLLLSPVVVFFFFFIWNLLSDSLLARTKDFSEDDKTVRETKGIRRSFAIENEIETGIEGSIRGREAGERGRK